MIQRLSFKLRGVPFHRCFSSHGVVELSEADRRRLMLYPDGDFTRTTHFPVENEVSLSATQQGKSIQLHTYKFPAAAAAKAVLLCLYALPLNFSPGYGEYVGSTFEYYAREFAEHGITSVGFDYRGFGRSEGIRGYIKKHDDNLVDLSNFIKSITDKELPLFGLGVGYGGTVLLDHAMRNSKAFKGLLAISPYLGTEYYSYFMKTARYLSPLFRPFKFLLGQVGVADFKMDGMGINLVYEDTAMKDPLFYKQKVKVSTGLEIMRAGRKVLKQPKKMSTSLMVFHGLSDQIACPWKVERFCKRASAKDKYFIPIDGSEHDLFTDKDYMDMMIKEMANWMLNRL